MTSVCVLPSYGIPFLYIRSSKHNAVCLAEEDNHRQKLCRLLELTRPASTWQPHLVQLLGQYILEEGAKQTLNFLQHVLLRGKEILQKQKDGGNNNKAMNNGYLIPVDKKLAPRVIDIDRWKTVLIALGFEIEQPDGYHSIEHVDVFIGEGVMITALDGMLLLLSLINSLHWDILRMIFTFTPEEAANLCSLIETTEPEFLEQQQSLAKAFLSRYPDEMRKLGLRKEHRKIVKRVFDLQQAQLCKTLSLVLTAIFQEGPPDTATFI